MTSATASDPASAAASVRAAAVTTLHKPWLGVVASLALVAAPLALCAALLAAWARVSGTPVAIAPIIAALFVVREIISFTAGAHYHRSLSHKHFDFHPVVERPLRVWNFFFMGSGRAWAVMHRLHHAETETDADPHSPYKTGESLWTIFAQTSRSYFAVARALQAGTPSMYSRFDVGLPEDAFERYAIWVSSKGIAGIALARAPVGIALLSLVFGSVPVAAAFFLCLMLSVWTGTILLINGVTHMWGYRTSPSRDRSTNVLPIDPIGWGELLHHNHHAFPGRANLAVMPWELDLGYWILVALAKVGVVRGLDRAG